MPIHSRASLRYARALLIAAEKRDGFGPLRQEVEALRDLIGKSPELRAFLLNPAIAKQGKLAILGNLFDGKVSPLLSQFLRMLTDRYRERVLPDILEATVSLLDEREGKVLAEVESAAEMSDEQQARLKKQLERLTGKQVQMAVRTETGLIAGFVARVGDTVFDASLAAQLARLRQLLGRANLRPAVQR